MRLFLRDILAEKRRRGDADTELFRRVASYEFAAGLNATAEGAARAMRRWVDSRPAWVSDAQQAGRVAMLAAIEQAFDHDRREEGTSASLGVRHNLTDERPTLQTLPLTPPCSRLRS